MTRNDGWETASACSMKRGVPVIVECLAKGRVAMFQCSMFVQSSGEHPDGSLHCKGDERSDISPP